MKTPTDEIERLDMAARSTNSLQFLSSGRWSLLSLNLTLIAGAILVRDSFTNPVIAPLVVVCAVFATVTCWTDWRYKLYVPAVWFLIAAIGSLLVDVGADDPTLTRIRGASLFGILSLAYWINARPFANVKGGWEREQGLVENWWKLLTGTPRRDDVIEFSTKSFWRGYYIYRLMKPGPYWVEARLYKRFGILYPSEFRVRKVSEVTFTGLPGDETKVRIGKRTMIATNLSPASMTNS